MNNREHKIEKMFDQLMLALITGVVAYSGSVLKDMSTEMQGLNQKVAVILERISHQESLQNDLKYRVEKLEERGNPWKSK